MASTRLCLPTLLLTALCTLHVASAHYPAYSYNNFYRGPPVYRLPTELPTLTVVQENAYAMDEKMARVPLVLVPGNRLRVVQGGEATYFHHTSYGQQELPCVRIELPQPLVVSRPTTMIEFPAGFSVIHDGYRHPLRVAAVLAPVFTLSGPQEIRVVYAIPSQTYAYPSYQAQEVRRPIQPASYYPISQAYLPPSQSYLPTQTYQPAQPARPTPVAQPTPPAAEKPTPVHEVSLPPSHLAPGKRPIVTILDFPSTVSSPNTLFFQPPLDPESELGLREPPQAVVPAGIVQSTQPIPNLSVFINSKESEVLQALRDEAQKHRLATANSYTGDYNIIVN